MSAPPAPRRAALTAALCLCSLCAPAWADEASARQAATELLAAAAAHDTAPWVQRWIGQDRGERMEDPDPERWTEALRDGGTLSATLEAGRGVAAVVAGPGYYRAVLETAPMLSVLVSNESRVIGLEWTSCRACDEPRRFALDLIEDVRHRGVLGTRLQPGLELLLAETDTPSGSRVEHWTAMFSARLSVAQDIASLIANAVVIDQSGQLLRVRYPDGRTDTWEAQHTPRGWALVYDALAEDSPLRLRTTEARRWRRISRRQEVAQASWEPSWASVDSGVGTVIGHHAVGASFGASPDAVVVVVLDIDRAHSAVFEVDTYTHEVLRSWELPVPADPVELRVGPWYKRWPTALSAERDRVLVATPEALWLLQLDTGELASLAEEVSLSAVGFSDTGAPFWATHDGQLHLLGEAHFRFDLGAAPIAVQIEGDEAVAALADGRLIGWRLSTGESTGSRAVCGGALEGATPNPRDDAWLFACGVDAPYGFEVAAGLAGSAVAFELTGHAQGPAAWSADGRRVAVAAPLDEGDAVAVWDLLHGVPLLTVGHSPALSLRFSDDGERLLAVTEGGDVVLWNLRAARQRRPVLGPRRPFPHPAP
jgi:hypothetical protein